MILKGEKVILRPIKMSDAPRFVKWLNDKDVNKYLQRHRVSRLTLSQEKQILKRIIKARKTKKNFIIETESKTSIGTATLEITPYDNRAVFGIFIGEKIFWDHGLGTDAAGTIIDYGFRKLKLHRIDLGVMDYNPRAIKVYRRLGFKLEGRRRDYVFYKNKYHDSFCMAILDREWKKRKK